MRRERFDRRGRDEKAMTLGDLSQAIEQRRLPYTLQGAEYVLRPRDVRALTARHEYPLGALPGMLPGHNAPREMQRETLQVSRTA